jgi:hypothetical protein
LPLFLFRSSGLFEFFLLSQLSKAERGRETSFKKEIKADGQLTELRECSCQLWLGVSKCGKGCQVAYLAAIFADFGLMEELLAE